MSILMRLDLSEIASHLGKRIRYEINEPPAKDLDGSIKCIAPVKGEVVFSNSGRHVVIRGSFNTIVELDCARCLQPYKIDMDIPVEEEFLIAGHVPDLPVDNEEEELLEEEKDPLFVDNLFDLTELIRQNIFVAVPIKPLCSEECKGLCPHCGKNLNEVPCECPPDTEESAFAALAELIEKEEKL